MLTIGTHLHKVIGNTLHEFMYYLKEYNKCIQLLCKQINSPFQRNLHAILH
jgi:hypothetical protein